MFRARYVYAKKAQGEMCKGCEVCMKTMNIIQSSDDGVSLDKRPLKALKNGL